MSTRSSRVVPNVQFQLVIIVGHTDQEIEGLEEQRQWVEVPQLLVGPQMGYNEDYKC